MEATAAVNTHQIAARADNREGLLQVEAVAGTIRLRLWGSLTTRSATRLRRALRRYADRGLGKIVLDLRRVGAVDVSGIAALLEARRLLEVEGGGLVVLRTSEPVTRALKTSGTIHAFHLSEESAT